MGSQWLICIPTQQALAGWSILDKLATLPAAELKETMYAQPASFLVQVGLFELLKSFGVFPDVVLGHSAGEVRCCCVDSACPCQSCLPVVFPYHVVQASNLLHSSTCTHSRCPRPTRRAC